MCLTDSGDSYADCDADGSSLQFDCSAMLRESDRTESNGLSDSDVPLNDWLTWDEKGRRNSTVYCVRLLSLW